MVRGMKELNQDTRRIRARLRSYEKKLRTEKERYGFYRDGAGKRYLVGPHYMLLADNEGALGIGNAFRPLRGESEVPWKECSQMDERLRFVARLRDGERMAALCREFGISRQTGSEIYHRYEDSGLDGISYIQAAYLDLTPGPAGAPASLIPHRRSRNGPVPW